MNSRSTLWITVVGLLVFTLGIVLGGGLVAWGANEFLIQPQAISTIHTGVVTKVAILEQLRAGKSDEAFRTLEDLLDGDLIALAALAPEYEHDHQLSMAINRAALYRHAYPYHSAEPSVDSRITELLSTRQP